MEAYEAIITRRSVRTFTSRPVPPEVVRKLLVAAMSAPSAGNQQPWHFVVVRARGTLEALAELLPHGKMLLHAPVAVVVCADLRLEVHAGYWVQDCAAATENLLLAAHALGLGGVWVGVYPREERVVGVRKLFALPDEVMPLCIVAIGYPGEPIGGAERYKEGRVHYERW
ncbi:MAG: nitroreductase family protein [candidate division KSB1 bacterium]|nr:nitroreductase family protein [candidate division KSB1 bacterium]MDZ7386702.1 nitroreductase family protein [candidate division KSB1 bacterium]MDZ7393784.1 nitroreductase family protein [candidate division KSB1 bacterium]